MVAASGGRLAAAAALAAWATNAQRVVCPSSGAQLAEVVRGAEECAAAGASCTQLCTSATIRSAFTCNQTVAELKATLGQEDLSCSDPFESCDSESLGYVLADLCARTVFAALDMKPDARCGNGVEDSTLVTLVPEFVTGEADVDCGGYWCNRCQAGSKCKFDSDCVKASTCSGDGICVINSSTQSGMDNFHKITIPILVCTAVLSIVFININDRLEKRRREREKRREEREAQLRETAARRARAPAATKAAKLNAVTRAAVGLKAGSEPSSAAASGESVDFAATPEIVVDSEAAIPAEVPKTLSQVLADPASRKTFYTFCKNKRAAENVLFWEAVSNYERMWDSDSSPAEVQLAARHIVERYVSKDCVSEVNLAYPCSRRIMSLYHASDPSGAGATFQRDSFDEAKSEIFTLMSSNFFAGFVQQQKSGLPVLDRAPSLVQVVAT